MFCSTRAKALKKGVIAENLIESQRAIGFQAKNTAGFPLQDLPVPVTTSNVGIHTFQSLKLELRDMVVMRVDHVMTSGGLNIPNFCSMDMIINSPPKLVNGLANIKCATRTGHDVYDTSGLAIHISFRAKYVHSGGEELGLNKCIYNSWMSHREKCLSWNA